MRNVIVILVLASIAHLSCSENLGPMPNEVKEEKSNEPVAASMSSEPQNKPAPKKEEPPKTTPVDKMGTYELARHARSLMPYTTIARLIRYEDYAEALSITLRQIPRGKATRNDKRLELAKLFADRVHEFISNPESQTEDRIKACTTAMAYRNDKDEAIKPVGLSRFPYACFSIAFEKKWHFDAFRFMLNLPERPPQHDAVIENVFMHMADQNHPESEWVLRNQVQKNGRLSPGLATAIYTKLVNRQEKTERSWEVARKVAEWGKLEASHESKALFERRLLSIKTSLTVSEDGVDTDGAFKTLDLIMQMKHVSAAEKKRATTLFNENARTCIEQMITRNWLIKAYKLAVRFNIKPYNKTLKTKAFEQARRRGELSYGRMTADGFVEILQ